MIYFRNYRLRVNFVISPGATIRDKNDEIIRGVTPITAIVVMHHPDDLKTYANKAANGLTREEARRKAVFKARRRLLEMVKNKKPCMAVMSDGTHRVTLLLDGARILGYGPSFKEAILSAQTTRMQMDEILTDISKTSLFDKPDPNRFDRTIKLVVKEYPEPMGFFTWLKSLIK